MSVTISSTEENTPAASRTDHNTATATNNVMPSATDSKNAVFMTDHGSTRISRSRALRIRPPRRVAAGRAGFAFAFGLSNGTASMLACVSAVACLLAAPDDGAADGAGAGGADGAVNGGAAAPDAAASRRCLATSDGGGTGAV